MRYSLDQVFEHIANLHSRDNVYDEEECDIGARVYQYNYFILEEVSVDEIDSDLWSHCEDTVDKYAEMNTPIPAIVLNDDRSTIIDGTHRVMVAKKKGLKTIQAFIGVI